MSSWQQRGYQWAVKEFANGSLVGSRAGGPLLARTRREIRALVKFNRMRDVQIVKVRITYTEVVAGE